mmetsp:Transcript_22638/g.57262  ORF Transcript_22638/g.57262 Transcript_22638/m.57262 type:complete len:261 (-) Transcript_22638:431-1213(-)
MHRLPPEALGVELGGAARLGAPLRRPDLHPVVRVAAPPVEEPHRVQGLERLPRRVKGDEARVPQPRPRPPPLHGTREEGRGEVRECDVALGGAPPLHLHPIKEGAGGRVGQGVAQAADARAKLVERDAPIGVRVEEGEALAKVLPCLLHRLPRLDGDPPPVVEHPPRLELERGLGVLPHAVEAVAPSDLLPEELVLHPHIGRLSQLVGLPHDDGGVDGAPSGGDAPAVPPRVCPHQVPLAKGPSLLFRDRLEHLPRLTVR